MSEIANSIFSPATAARFDHLVTLYPVKRSALVPMLLYAQDEVGYVSDGTAKPYRVHMRNADYANLQALETMCKGRLLADVVAVIGSLDIVLGAIDR